MCDKIMQDFMNKYLSFPPSQEIITHSTSKITNNRNTIILSEFTITLMNPANFGSKGGIIIEQLIIPFR